MPEYIYQEALGRKLVKEQFDVRKELVYHPLFDGEALESYIKMDMVVMMPRGNIIIECKSIKEITDREQFQTFGYLRGTSFPIAILVNFGTWPKAQIERYYYHEGMGRFRGCDRFYAVRQFYAKAIFVMGGLFPVRGGAKVME